MSSDTMPSTAHLFLFFHEYTHRKMESRPGSVPTLIQVGVWRVTSTRRSFPTVKTAEKAISVLVVSVLVCVNGSSRKAFLPSC